MTDDIMTALFFIWIDLNNSSNWTKVCSNSLFGFHLRSLNIMLHLSLLTTWLYKSML